MGKGFNNYMCKKFFHPASRDNLKRVWMAEQKADSYKKKQDELRQQYEKEQDLYTNKAILSKESKDKLSVNFMYEPPPGTKKEREREDDEPEYKFEWQRKFNAPREDYCKGDSEIRDQPFGIQVRNVRCIKCHKWGHINTDKECPMYCRSIRTEPEGPSYDPMTLVQQMREDGLAMKKSAFASQQHLRFPANQKLLESSEDEDGSDKSEMEFLKSLSKEQKQKLLKKLDKLEKKEAKKKSKKKKHSERKSKKKDRKKKSSDSDSDAKAQERKMKSKEKKILKKIKIEPVSSSEEDNVASKVGKKFSAARPSDNAEQGQRSNGHQNDSKPPVNDHYSKPSTSSRPDDNRHNHTFDNGYAQTSNDNRRDHYKSDSRVDRHMKYSNGNRHEDFRNPKHTNDYRPDSSYNNSNRIQDDRHSKHSNDSKHDDYRSSRKRKSSDEASSHHKRRS